MDSETSCLAGATCVLRFWEWHHYTAAAVAGAVAAAPGMLQQIATSSSAATESSPALEAAIASSLSAATNEAPAPKAAAKKFRCKGRQPHAALGACMHFHSAARKGGVGVKQREVGKGRPELKRAGKGNTEPRSLQRSPKTLTHQEREAGGAGDQSNKERNTAARAPPGELVNTRKGKIVTGKRNADQEQRESTAQSGTARERTAQSGTSHRNSVTATCTFRHRTQELRFPQNGEPTRTQRVFTRKRKPR